MADSEKKDEQKETEKTSPPEGQQFTIQKIFLKDTSFESPNSPDIFTDTWEPNINIELNSNGRNIGEKLHEVVLGITVTAKIGEKVAYLVEVQQSGIFALTNFSEQEMSMMLGSYCPNLLYPFAREVISDLVLKGGFPQMILAPVNFDAIYQDHVKRQQLEAKDAGAIH